MAKKRPSADWEAIEREYRAGQISVNEIARGHDLTPQAIRVRAKRYGWVRNLSEQVREQINAHLVTDAVTPGVTPANAREVIEAAGLRGADVVRAHRKDISRGRALVDLLYGQLEQAATNRAEIEEAIEEETAEDRSPKRRAMLMQLVSLSSHAGTLRDLSTVLKNLIPLERKAFNLDAPGESEAPRMSKEHKDAVFRAALGGDYEGDDA